MQVYQTIYERYIYKFELTILILCIVCLGYKAPNFYNMVFNQKNVQSITKENPLLLNSGIIESNKAEVSITLWFEDGDISSKICLNRPIPGWVWTSNTLQTESGKTAKTISGRHFVNKNEENILFTWYTTMAQELAKVGGKIYFDERVPQTLDVSAYLSKINALPSQSFFLGNMVSIAGYISNLKGYVWAGRNRMNIQLLSRGNTIEGQSVLAMPALLEEF